MRRLAYALAIAAVAVGLMAPPASAAPHNLSGLLGNLWTTVLEDPIPDNPFAGGDPCVHLRGNVVAPLAGEGVPSCTVSRGTKILFSGWTTECSTFEDNGTTEEELRACAVSADESILSSATLDGTPIQLSSVQTKLLEIQLPEDNIFGLTDNLAGLAVAHGYEYLTRPLRPGTHTIVNDVVFGDGTTSEFTTVINVR
jgi:hypothetical protein